MVSMLTDIANREGALEAALSRSGKKNDRGMIWAIVALLCVCLAIGAWKSFAKPPKPKTIEVLALKQSLAPGCKLVASSFGFIEISPELYSKKLFTSAEHLLGRTSCKYIPAQQPILDSDLLPEGSSFADLLQPDQRAFSLKFEPDGTVDHCLQTGDFVDVVLSANKNGGNYSRTICQNLRVLLASPKDIAISRHSSDANTVVLAAAPSEIETLTEGKQTGKLYLSLRARTNHQIEKLSGAQESDVLPEAALNRQKMVPASPASALVATPPPPPVPSASTPPEAPAAWIVEIFKGAEKFTESFESK